MRVDIKGREQIMSDASIMADTATTIRVTDDFPNEHLASDFVVINQPKNNNQHNAIKMPFQVKLKLKSDSSKSFQSISVYRLNADYTTMFKIESNLVDSGDQVSFEASHYGAYVAKIESNYASLIIGLSCAAIFLALCGSIGVILFKNPEFFRHLKYRNVKRSMADSI